MISLFKIVLQNGTRFISKIVFCSGQKKKTEILYDFDVELFWVDNIKFFYSGFL